MCYGFKGWGKEAGQKGAGPRTRHCWPRTGGQEAMNRVSGRVSGRVLGADTWDLPLSVGHVHIPEHSHFTEGGIGPAPPS